jgi:hypothetical protein
VDPVEVHARQAHRARLPDTLRSDALAPRQGGGRESARPGTNRGQPIWSVIPVAATSSRGLFQGGYWSGREDLNLRPLAPRGTNWPRSSDVYAEDRVGRGDLPADRHVEHELQQRESASDRRGTRHTTRGSRLRGRGGPPVCGGRSASADYPTVPDRVREWTYLAVSGGTNSGSVTGTASRTVSVRACGWQQ